jgi:hypothetical protein
MRMMHIARYVLSFVCHVPGHGPLDLPSCSLDHLTPSSAAAPLCACATANMLLFV